jgi:hypothetical protein
LNPSDPYAVPPASSLQEYFERYPNTMPDRGRELATLAVCEHRVHDEARLPSLYIMLVKWVKRIPEGLLILVALPAYQLWYIAKYANTRKGWAAKIGAFISFLPLIVICSVIWGFIWFMMLWSLWRDIN